MRQCLKIIVSGRVTQSQFHTFVQQEAQRLSVEGTVQNAEDGTVVILACGLVGALDSLMDALYKGCPGAEIEKIAAEPLLPSKDFRGVFRIIG